MSKEDKEFTGSIPEFYDKYLVPLIFESYARDIAARVITDAPQIVLETAAGSGVVTRALAPLLSPIARYVVTDLNEPMLDHAKAMQGEDPRIQWQSADALKLPFSDGEFDSVVCQFGVMFFPDRRAGLSEAARVLKPGGRFVFNVWDDIEHNEFADVVTNAATQIFPADPPLFLARTPHGYSDIERVKSDLLAVGFSTIDVDTVTEQSVAATARHPAIAYCYGTPLRNEIVARDSDALDEVTEKACEAIANKFGRGPVSGKIRGHVFVATV